MTNPEFLTSRELAAHFRVSRETVIRWVRDGTVPVTRLPGGAFRFRLPEVEAAIAAVRGEAPSEATA